MENKPIGKHAIQDEDGRVYDHPGYMYRPCTRDGRLFLVAVNRFEEFTTCGDKDCGKLATST